MKKITLITVITLLVVILNTFSNSLYADSIDFIAGKSNSFNPENTSVNSNNKEWFYSYGLSMNPNIVAGNVTTLPVQSSNSTITSENNLKMGVVTQSVSIKQVEIKPVVVSKPTYSQPVGLNAYLSTINAAASKYGANASIMARIIMCESGGNPNAHNASGATGIAQFMPGTYYGVQRRAPELKQYPLNSATGQIYALAFKLSKGEGSAWVCYPK